MSLLTIASFEFRSRLKLLSTWVYFLVFLTIALLWIAAAGGLFKDASISFGSGKVAVNSPYALAQTIAVLSLLGITVVAAVMGRAVQQDAEYRTESFFFTAPLAKSAYLGGRFLGALGVLLVIFSSVGVGAFIATMLPGMDADRLGANHWSAYLSPYATVLVPNAILIGALFFALAAVTRKMLPVYVGSVLILLGWLISAQFGRDVEYRAIAALADPFGVRALSSLTEYWTIAERNARIVPLAGVLLWNRLLWLGVAVLVSAFCFWRFSFAETANAPSRKRGKVVIDPAIAAPQAGEIRTIGTPAGADRSADATSTWRLVPHRAWLEFRETTKNIYFGVLVLAGLLFLVFASTTLGDRYGTSTWPLTFQMLGLVTGSFAAFMLIIITFYAGELVWRERDNRLDQISDALPTPTWLPLVSKLVALMLVPVVLQIVLMLCGMAIQAFKGYTRFEPGLYLYDLFSIDLVGYWLICALAISVHSIVDNKYVGHFVMVVYYVLLLFASSLGLEHNLYKFGSVPGAIYSDMNGYGHFLTRLRAFQAYWAAASVLLLVLAYLFWTRGTPSSWRERWAQARARLNARSGGLALVSGLAFVALGGFIFWNTNLLNHYETTATRQTRQADYEKKYKATASEAQPKITAVMVDVDLFPAEQRARMRGHYALENRSGRAVTTLELGFAAGQDLVVHQLDVGVPATLVDDTPRLGVRRYALASPLPPGATTTLTFDLELPTRGFLNEGSNTAVVYNGSFLNGRALLPSIGYQERGELERDQDRKKYGLAPKERLRDRDDPVGLQVNAFGPDADFIDYEATVSTEADQIAVSPGYLQREWLEGGRRYFHYRMDAPIVDFFAFQSARYAEKKDVWHGPNGDVALDIYYQPGHEFNLDSMDASAKDALAYCSANFGAYQYRQFRILEFPRYEEFAQSFPNTIPYSEAIGFIARVRADDPKDIDYPYYVTAHEAAHQWWGHQVVPGNVQGDTMLVESLAQYSALMVMKRRLGPEKMRRFLRYELDRYLLGRAIEQKKELPLSRVEDQPYIHYAKGSLVFYALQDYIGEDKLNQALRAFRDAHAFKGPPYPNTTELIARIREVTPAELQYMIDDMFEKIVVYDNHATSASMKALPGGRWQVTMQVVARKFVADALGKESDAPLNDLIDIGVVDADGNAIAVEKKRLTSEQSTFTLVVDRKPAKAGIDPLNKLIDRKPEDNTIPISGG
jgi:ABC-2 type transport system permease protein